MKLEIDNREHALIDAMELEQSHPFEKKTLELGDIVIKDDNDNIRIIIERKTPSDLMSSIKDGRYTEQALRLNALDLHNHNIIYLIEGNYLHHKDYNTILSAMFSIFYFKGFTIWQSSNITTSKQLILKFLSKLEKEKDKLSFYENSNLNNDYLKCIKSNKKENIDIHNIHEIMLMQIPQVSSIVAKVVMDKYKNIFNLKNVLTADETSLYNLKYKTTTGKERKLNSLAVKNIIHFLASENKNYIYE